MQVPPLRQKPGSHRSTRSHAGPFGRKKRAKHRSSGWSFRGGENVQKEANVRERSLGTQVRPLNFSEFFFYIFGYTNVYCMYEELQHLNDWHLVVVVFPSLYKLSSGPLCIIRPKIPNTHKIYTICNQI